MLRQLVPADIAGVWRVRYAVQENRLTSTTIDDEELLQQSQTSGRGWVIEIDGEIRAFAIGNAETGNIWALFVDPAYEGRGYARRLMAELVQWLWSQSLQRLTLSTDPGTRAEAFYRRAGWHPLGLNTAGEMRFELLRTESASNRPKWPH